MSKPPRDTPSAFKLLLLIVLIVAAVIAFNLYQRETIRQAAPVLTQLQARTTQMYLTLTPP